MRTVLYLRVLSLIVLGTFFTKNCFCQTNEYKYSLVLSAGWMPTLGGRGPKETTEVGKVKFLHPWSAVFDGYLNISVQKNIFLGFEFATDQYDWGYKAPQIYPVNGISSGLLTTTTNINFYKAGIRIGYEVPIFKRLLVQASITPFVGYLPHYSELDDTSTINAYDYKVRAPGTGAVQYVALPPYQNSKPQFVLKAAALVSYRVGRRFFMTLDAAYQQGFSTFFIDYVNIRQIEPQTHTIDQHIYYTKINGTSFQFHLGIRYDFGRSK